MDTTRPHPVCPRSHLLKHYKTATVLALALMLVGAMHAQEAKKSSAPAPPQGGTVSPSAPPVSSAELTAADLEAFLDGLIPAQLQREDIAGAVVAVVKDGHILFSKGYGFSDLEKRKPVSPPQTLFRPASIS